MRTLAEQLKPLAATMEPVVDIGTSDRPYMGTMTQYNLAYDTIPGLVRTGGFWGTGTVWSVLPEGEDAAGDLLHGLTGGYTAAPGRRYRIVTDDELQALGLDWLIEWAAWRSPNED